MSNISNLTPASMTPQIIKLKACVGCRTRKVRCDRQSPCTNCSRWALTCTYPESVRKCARPAKKQTQEVLNALKNLVSNSRVSGHASSHLPKALRWSDRHVGKQTQTSWRYFCERVDPVVKILHRPVVEKIVQQSTFRASSLHESERALVHAIYFSSITCMPENEVYALFGLKQETAVEIYRLSTEEALTQAILLRKNEDLLALQALVLFLSVIRLSGETSVSWKLTGIARRSTIFTKSDSSIFEKEMLKRLWWQLWYLDHRAAKDLGQDDELDRPPKPDMPLNINDSDFDLDSFMPPIPRCGWTEQTFPLVRYEIARTRQKLNINIKIDERRKLIKECEIRLQDVHLRYCTDNLNPIQWFIRHVAHVLVMEMWFELYSADTIPLNIEGEEYHRDHQQSIQDQLFLEAIDIVDTSTRLEAEPQSRQWAWLLKGYQQFRPLVFLLNELQYRQECPAVTHAWSVVEKAFVRWPDQIRESTNGQILDKLRERANVVQSRLRERNIRGINMLE